MDQGCIMGANAHREESACEDFERFAPALDKFGECVNIATSDNLIRLPMS